MSYEVHSFQASHRTLWYVESEGDLTEPFDTKEVATNVANLLNQGYAELCPVCSGVSVYSWDDADEENGIMHIPVCSGEEWQCGHCNSHLVEADSLILQECYTHQPAHYQTCT